MGKYQTKMTLYEWDYEVTDLDQEVKNHIYCEQCPGLPNQDMFDDDEICFLVLVKNVFHCEELVDRQWAYVDSGKLPEFFYDYAGGGDKVPQRFHKELAKFTKN